MHQEFSVRFQYPVHFTENIFKEENLLLRNIVESPSEAPAILVVLDQGLESASPNIREQIERYFKLHKEIIRGDLKIISIPGGEDAKNDLSLVFRIVSAVNEFKICRHSYLIAVGGGAVLDLAGFAAAISHRGIRHIRIPSTVLSQNDSGVGVKNGVNFEGKKNFLGTFAPPYAVINDHTLLKSLSDRDWMSGVSEAIKVSLIKDKAFFVKIQSISGKLVNRDEEAMKYLIQRCAELHLEHIGGNDPFESGSSRPLDFGHWAAHKLEQLSNNVVKHGEAVAAGIALDSVYSMLIGFLNEDELSQILSLLKNLGFQLYFDAWDNTMNLLSGVAEFREHLGGKLTIMLLESIGRGKEVNEIKEDLMIKALSLLKMYQKNGYLQVTES